MGRTLDEVISSLPAARRREIAARTQELIAEELTLRALAQAMVKTRRDLAKKLAVGQDAISRVEKRADMLLSTLSEHVRGLGGELKLIAEFPDRAPVRITGFTLIGAGREQKSKRTPTAPLRKRVSKRKSAEKRQ